MTLRVDTLRLYIHTYSLCAQIRPPRAYIHTHRHTGTHAHTHTHTHTERVRMRTIEHECARCSDSPQLPTDIYALTRTHARTQAHGLIDRHKRKYEHTNKGANKSTKCPRETRKEVHAQDCKVLPSERLQYRPHSKPVLWDSKNHRHCSVSDRSSLV